MNGNVCVAISQRLETWADNLSHGITHSWEWQWQAIYYVNPISITCNLFMCKRTKLIALFKTPGLWIWAKHFQTKLSCQTTTSTIQCVHIVLAGFCNGICLQKYTNIHDIDLQFMWVCRGFNLVVFIYSSMLTHKISWCFFTNRKLNNKMVFTIRTKVQCDMWRGEFDSITQVQSEYCNI